MLSQRMIKSTGRVLWNNDHLFYYRLEQNTVFTSLILIKYETGPKRVFFINFETPYWLSQGENVCFALQCEVDF